MPDNPDVFLPADGPQITRVRHELRRRTLTVVRVEWVTPAMLRLGLTGDLGGFASAAPDDHIKIVLTAPDGTVERRDYTPRRFDVAAQTLDIDFAMHEAGPVTRWAMDARPGDSIEIGGPRGSAVVTGVSRWLLIGDETALPAIGRRIEEASAGTEITMLAAVAGPAEEQAFTTPASLTCLWAYRPLAEATDAAALLAVLKTLPLQPETFVWIAAEASVTRALRAYLTEERGLALGWLKASGYWVKGKADATEKFD